MSSGQLCKLTVPVHYIKITIVTALTRKVWLFSMLLACRVTMLAVFHNAIQLPVQYQLRAETQLTQLTLHRLVVWHCAILQAL